MRKKKPNPNVPMQSELEARLGHKIITYDHGNNDHRPGGQCSCCGSGPNAEPEWRGEPWYVYRAGFCDSDGVFYSMLCEGCLEELEFEYQQRPKTLRDEMAEALSELLGEDIDGVQAMMEDFGGIEPDAYDCG